MLIYCSHLWLRPSGSTKPVLAAVAEWLTQKTRRRIDPSELVDGVALSLPGGYSVEVASAEAVDETQLAIRLRHRDGAVRERDWLTDVGLRMNEGAARCSVVLATHEHSRFVPPVIETTRPRVVTMICDKCTLDSRTVGGTPQRLTLEDAEAFDYRVKDGEREFPIVLISCDRDGVYLVDPARSASLLIGLAEVVAIPSGVDTFRLEGILGERYSAYGGAVTIIWRRTRFGDRDLVPSTKLVPEVLLELKARAPSLDAELLARICHRTNATLARHATTLDDVRRASAQAQLAHALKGGGAEAAELKDLYAAVDVDQRNQIKSLQEEVSRKEEECGQLRDDLDEARRTNDALKQHLSAAGSTRPMAQTATPAPRMLLECMIDDPSLEQCLEVIAGLFPDRVVILDSARASAKRAAEFKHGRRALKLLWRLCDDFWALLNDGKGTNEAKDVLGDAYAANESESARNNKRAKDLRTFTYRGAAVEMMQHLRIGVKQDSFAETWRAHFHWDPDRRVIVIGHCGGHLDHR